MARLVQTHRTKAWLILWAPSLLAAPHDTTLSMSACAHATSPVQRRLVEQDGAGSHVSEVGASAGRRVVDRALQARELLGALDLRVVLVAAKAQPADAGGYQENDAEDAPAAEVAVDVVPDRVAVANLVVFGADPHQARRLARGRADDPLPAVALARAVSGVPPLADRRVAQLRVDELHHVQRRGRDGGGGRVEVDTRRAGRRGGEVEDALLEGRAVGMPQRRVLRVLVVDRLLRV